MTGESGHMMTSFLSIAAATLLPLAMFKPARDRLDLSLAKHPSLTGHPRTARRVASLMSYYSYDDSTFFNSDDAPADIAATRRAALAGMSAPRAILAGFALGLAESLVTSQFGALAQDPIVFLLLIGVALWQSRKVRFGGSLRA